MERESETKRQHKKMNNLSATLFFTLLIIFCATTHINAQFDVPGGFEMAMKEGYNQYTLTDDQRRNIGQQIMGMRNENRDNNLSTGDQTSQYAQIMSRMGQEQQSLQNEGEEDQEARYADIQSQGMNNKPQDQFIDANSNQNGGVTEAIDPLTMRGDDNQMQTAQYGVTEAIDPRSLDQSNDQTSNYAFIEQEKHAKQERIARKNEERSRNDVPIAVQAIDPQEFLAFQQTGEKQQEQLTSGFDQTEYFSNVMRGKAAVQDQLANEQSVTSGLGVFQAIDPQNLSQQQQQAPSGIKSWSSLNAKSVYLPQASGRKQSSSNYDFQSLNSANNNADQTSDYLRIMAQQRRIQQELQSL